MLERLTTGSSSFHARNCQTLGAAPPGSSRNTRRPGPAANTFTVLTATARGREAAHRAAVDAGHVPEQQTWTGLVKPAELSHDTAVYRAALDEAAAHRG